MPSCSTEFLNWRDSIGGEMGREGKEEEKGREEKGREWQAVGF